MLHTETATGRRNDVDIRWLLENLPAAAYTCDSNGLITYFNQRAVGLWGRSPKVNDPEDRFCGSFRLFAADGSPIRHDQCWMALALQENQEFNGHEIVIERPDGTRVTALAHANPLRDEEGDLSGAVNVLVDITERKAAEEARAFLAAIVSSSQDVIITKTLDGIITSWNDAAERLYGYTAEEVVGNPITLLLPPERPDEFPAIMERIRRGERVEPYETVRVAKDGRRIDIWLTVSPIHTSDDRVIGASAIARDITERKRLQTELEEALRLRNEVLATVTHDLKSPLAGISGLAQVLELQLLRGRDPTPGQLTAGLRSIHERAVDMARQLDELLDVAALEAGRPLDLQRETTDLVMLARRVATDVQGTTNRHQIRVAVEDSQEVTGEWDPKRLERVLHNLLKNAVKFSPDGGTVTVSISGDDNSEQSAVLTVRDEGVGIPASELPTIFNRFQRGTNVAGRIDGTGLGLAAVRQIVEQHGGSIAIESQEGIGTAVTVRLPIAASLRSWSAVSTL
jgi:PAS domain S-box-containing protein